MAASRQLIAELARSSSWAFAARGIVPSCAAPALVASRVAAEQISRLSQSRPSLAQGPGRERLGAFPIPRAFATLAGPGKSIMTVTPTAAERIQKLMGNRNDPTTIGVRVGLRTRGCNGMSYTMDYTDKVNKFDEVIEADNGVKVVVDSKAVMFLIGTEMDFVTNEVGTEFVFNNPNKKSECGCGQSFTT